MLARCPVEAVMRSFRLCSAAVVTLTVGWIAVPGLPAAAAPEPEGWQRVFAEDFATNALPQQCTRFDGPPVGQAAAYYRPDEAQVSGGMLRLSIRRRDFADRPYTSGGLGCYGVAQVYGRYVYRAKPAPGVGIDSHVTLWPEEGADEDATVVEISATESSGEVLRLSNGYGAGVNHKETAGRFEDGFHEYVIEWAPGGLRVLVDGVVKIVDHRVSAKRRWVGFAVSTGDEDTGLPGQATLPAEFLVDWVRVYSYQPGSTMGSTDFKPSSPASSATVRPDRPRRNDTTALVLLIALMVAISSYIGIQWARWRHSPNRT
jgi:beta-glucanase (GH16 family)